MNDHYYAAQSRTGRSEHLVTPGEARYGLSGWRPALCGAEVPRSRIRTTDGPHALRHWQENEPELCGHCWKAARGERVVAL